MRFKKGQVVRNRISKLVFIVTDDQQGRMVRVRYIIGGRYARLYPENLTLIGNNVQPLKPRDATRATPNTPNCRCAVKPMAGIPQRPAEEAPPRHGAVTDKLRELMNAVASKDEQIRVLQKLYDDAHTEIAFLRTKLAEANRKNKWWQL